MVKIKLSFEGTLENSTEMERSRLTPDEEYEGETSSTAIRFVQRGTIRILSLSSLIVTEVLTAFSSSKTTASSRTFEKSSEETAIHFIKL